LALYMTVNVAVPKPFDPDVPASHALSTGAATAPPATSADEARNLRRLT
jgi:hypothetical protein